ncbi:MarR family winged helix-turn-helix transcriptional regulator [Cupriavidus sp. 2TAF22]|uniref:MarR family winged helix-turn-helix transcriptional regulator n=1 Tax=unclassified Cupriavidus TaxID=2640874 RepID=UPI003F8F0C46
MTSRYIPIALDRTLTHRLHELNKLTDRVTQLAYESEVGIPMHEGRCLAAIGSFSPLSVNDLARRANLDKGQASRAAQSLVDKGLVRKTASATDGRGVVLTVTTQGERIWLRTMALIERRNAEIMSCLDEDERKQFDDLLERLVVKARE